MRIQNLPSYVNNFITFLFLSLRENKKKREEREYKRWQFVVYKKSQQILPEAWLTKEALPGLENEADIPPS